MSKPKIGKVSEFNRPTVDQLAQEMLANTKLDTGI